MTTTPAGAAATAASASGQDRAAFDRLEHLRSSVDAQDFPPYNLDVRHAVSTALGIAARVAPHRAAMIALPGFQPDWLDTFGDKARALDFVQTETLRRTERAKVLPVLAEDGWALRTVMMDYAQALSSTGHFAPTLLGKLREGSGYDDLIQDLKILVQEFLALPAAQKAEGLPVTQKEIDRAAEIAEQMTVVSGVGVELDLSQAALLDERRKLAGLLLAAWTEIRRAMTYLRWHEGDAARLVPSLHSGGAPRKAGKAAEDEVPEELAELHDQLHAHDRPLDPEDDPFTKE